jgi:hypothetical protein
MGEYRAYTVGVDGHFIRIEPLICRDDAEAIETAMVSGHDMESFGAASVL